MQNMAAALKRSRFAILTLAFLLSVGFGSVAAASSEISLTECKQSGCARGYATDKAPFQIVSVSVWSGGGSVSTDPLEMGFTQ